MLTKILPSYLYTQYADDVNLQSFVSAYNTMTQEYLDWFNTINLPIYTVQSGTMLDWVAYGLYGLPRPAIGNGILTWSAPLNSFPLNSEPINATDSTTAGQSTLVSDDIYKRIITWFFYKGDGQVLNINWLKRRITRFLLGVDGTAPSISYTPQVSVTLQPNNVVVLHINTNVVVPSSIPDAYGLYEYSQINTISNNVISRSIAMTLKNAIDSGLLELPFQFTYQVNVT